MKYLIGFLKSGMWMQPIVLAILISWIRKNQADFLLTTENKLVVVFISFLPGLIYWMEELKKVSKENAIMGKEKAMYPKINKNLLFKEPVGIVFGKHNKKYVCKDLTEDGHVFVIGGSGSGKSSCVVIPTLLANPTVRIFAIDIKGELSLKSTAYDDPHNLIFNPQDRNSYGYDPFYRLNEESSTQEIVQTMSGIANAFIQKSADKKDEFWKSSSRKLLQGLLIYLYKQGVTEFVPALDEILGMPLKERIQEVIKKSVNRSAEYQLLVDFAGMADETLGPIMTDVTNHVNKFTNDQDLRFAFYENANKINPLMLEEGYSIFLSIKEEKLTDYNDVLQLILNQTLEELEKRKENSEKIIFIIDEFPRIVSAGKLERLLDGNRTLRSRNVCLFFVTQSMEALMSAYTENEVADLVSNCPFIVILSATSIKTQKMIISWVGKYSAKKRSWSGSGKDRKVTISYEDRDIVEASELMSLTSTGELILITPYGYQRIRKCPYYKDKFFQKKAEEILKRNKEILEIQEIEETQEKTKEETS